MKRFTQMATLTQHTARLGVCILEDRLTPVIASTGIAPATNRGDAVNDAVVRIDWTNEQGNLLFDASGALISSERHILTAAHVLRPNSAGGVRFELVSNTGPESEPIDINIKVFKNADGLTYQRPHEGFTAQNGIAADIGLITLVDQAIDVANRSTRHMVAPKGPVRMETFSPAAAPVELTQFNMVGYGVIGEGKDGNHAGEVQAVQVVNPGTVGASFRLGYGVYLTDPIGGTLGVTFVTAAEVAAKLAALPSIGNGDVYVKKSVADNGDITFYVRFTGALFTQNVPALTVQNVLGGAGFLPVVSTLWEGGLVAGVKRAGQNKFDERSKDANNEDNFLLLDFDDGTEGRNAIAGSDLGVANESNFAPGDSGSPAIVQNLDGTKTYVVGVASHNFVDAKDATDYKNLQDKPLADSSFGEKGAYTRTSAYHDWVNTHTAVDSYHLVFDMSYQVLGLDTAVEDLTFTVKKVAVAGVDYLVIEGSGSADNKYNGEYYRQPLSKITGLTIRGSNDNETFVIPNDIVLAIDIEGGGGSDTLRFKTVIAHAGPNVTFKGGEGQDKIEVIDETNGGTTYTQTQSAIVIAPGGIIQFTNTEALTIRAGTATDVIKLVSIDPAMDTDFGGGGGLGRDRVQVVSGAVTTPKVVFTDLETLDILGGSLDLGSDQTFEEFYQSGGTLSGTNDLFVSQVAVWSGGTENGNGGTVALPGSTFTTTGPAALTDRLLVNSGTGTLSGNVSGSGGVYENTALGTLSVTGSLTAGLINAGNLDLGAVPYQVTTFTVGGDHQQLSTGTTTYDLPGATNDVLTVGGAVTLAGAAVLRGTPTADGNILLLSKTSSGSISGAYSNLAEGTIVTLGTRRYRATYLGGDGNDLTLLQLGSIGDRVWHDLNADNVQDSNESGLAGIAVNLLDSTGATLRSTSSDSQGLFTFDDVRPGTYTVQFDAPSSYLFSDGGDGSRSVVVARGDVLTDVDAGLYREATLGGLAWEDLNLDGVHDTNEPVLSGRTVTLRDADGDQLSTAQTSSDGRYQFIDLRPGDYELGIDGSPTYHYLNDTRQVTAVSGDVRTDLDFAAYRPASIGDRVWNDANANGVQDSGESGLAGVAVALASDDGQQNFTTTTDASGAYSFYDLHSFMDLALVSFRRTIAGCRQNSGLLLSGSRQTNTLSAASYLQHTQITRCLTPWLSLSSSKHSSSPSTAPEASALHRAMHLPLPAFHALDAAYRSGQSTAELWQ